MGRMATWWGSSHAGFHGDAAIHNVSQLQFLRFFLFLTYNIFFFSFPEQVHVVVDFVVFVWSREREKIFTRPNLTYTQCLPWMLKTECFVWV